MVYPESIGYNPKETTMFVVALMLFIELISPNMFAKKSLLSIAMTVGKPIAIYKVTKISQHQAKLRSRL